MGIVWFMMLPVNIKDNIHLDFRQKQLDYNSLNENAETLPFQLY